MSYSVIVTSRFKRELKSLAKKHRSLKEDMETLITQLESNPFQGDELSPGYRKIRLAIKSKGKGKSGGARVITYTLLVANQEIEGEVYLLSIYDKSEYSSISIDILRNDIDC